jgi:hypothetical protein
LVVDKRGNIRKRKQGIKKMNDLDFLFREMVATQPILCEIAGEEIVRKVISAVIVNDTSGVEKIVILNLMRENLMPQLIGRVKIFHEGLSLLKENRIDEESFIDIICKKFKKKKREPSTYIKYRNFHRECLKHLDSL